MAQTKLRYILIWYMCKMRLDVMKYIKHVIAFCAVGLCLQTYAEERREPLDKVENETVYFLSFSIPETQLVAVMKEAERNQLPIYIRGLIKNDMKTTANAIKYLVQKHGIKGVNIDPMRFDYYGIEAVPALVKKCGNKFDVVYGNGSINHALDLIEQEGECK